MDLKMHFNMLISLNCKINLLTHYFYILKHNSPKPSQNLRTSCLFVVLSDSYQLK